MGKNARRGTPRDRKQGSSPAASDDADAAADGGAQPSTEPGSPREPQPEPVAAAAAAAPVALEPATAAPVDASASPEATMTRQQEEEAMAARARGINLVKEVKHHCLRVLDVLCSKGPSSRKPCTSSASVC